MRRQKGFTLVELMVVVTIGVVVVATGATIYILCHFLAKFW
jgi:prepilin-type N-terminal cleavage/methylation domain-containing protein